ncbi:MAG TPA: hypothetical protein VGM94_04530 [Galbitalea sp.]
MTEKFAGLDDRRWRVSLEDALLQHARIVSDLSVIASVDSALYQHLLRGDRAREVIQLMPARLHSIQNELDAAAMSGTESKLRVALCRAGLRVRSQVFIAGVGIVDLLVDDWLIIEVDSAKHHDKQVAQHRDRVRDGASVIGKWGYLRFDYELVQSSLDWCVRVTVSRLESGRPVRTP